MIEATTYKFAKCLQERFGIIKDITDHNYITNSYHVSVRDKVDPFTKFDIESKFQKLSPGGLDNLHSRKATLKYVNPAKGCARKSANGRHYLEIPCQVLYCFARKVYRLIVGLEIGTSLKCIRCEAVSSCYAKI